MRLLRWQVRNLLNSDLTHWPEHAGNSEGSVKIEGCENGKFGIFLERIELFILAIKLMD